MSESISLPREHYYLFISGITFLTLFYLYSIHKKDFKLDLKSTLDYQSRQLDAIMKKSEKPKVILTPDQEKRLLLERRDRQAVDDDFKPPERRDPEHSYPTREVRNLINIPSRGMPDNYHSIGTLVRKSDEKILQLFGRQKYPGSNQWEYYATGMDANGFPNKMPVKVKGDREIEDKQSIDLDWLDKSKGSFEVNLYNYDVPRYNPYDY